MPHFHMRRGPIRALTFLPLLLPATAFAETVALPDLVVGASLTPVESSEVGSAVTVIDRKQLERNQTTILSDALRDAPGVSVERSGGPGTKTDVYLRGAKSNHTLVLIDGVEVDNPVGGSAFDFGDLLASDVERVEVLRGPQSALWGSDAIGGVINVVTKRGSGKPKVTTALEGGSFGTLHARSNVAGSGEGYHFSLSGDRYQTDGISAGSERRGNRERDGYQNNSLIFKGGVSPTEQLDIDLAARLVDARLKYDDFAYSPVYDVQQATDADIVEYRKQYFGRLSAEHRSFDDHWRNRIEAAVTSYNAVDKTNRVRDTEQNGLRHKFAWRSSVDFATDSGLPAKHTLTGLVESERESAFFKSAWTKIAPSTSAVGLAAEYRLDLTRRIHLSGSLRRDLNDDFKDATTYRLTAAYVHTETGTKLRSSVGTGVKNPTLFQLYGYTSTFQGNRDLKPEKSVGWDIGVDQPLWNKRLTLGATFFHNDIDNLITGSGQTAVNVKGISRIQGVELTANVQPIDGLDVSGALTIQSSRDADGKELVRRPKHTGSLNASYRFADDRASAFVSARFNGARQDTGYDMYFSPSRVTLPGYTRVDIGGSYQVIEKRLEVFGRIENLFDEKYEEVFTYGSPGVAGFAGIKVSF